MQLAYPLLKASGSGSVVMNSSVAGGPAAIKTGALYAMSKGEASGCCWKLAVARDVEGKEALPIVALHLLTDCMFCCSGNESAHAESRMRVGPGGHQSQCRGALVHAHRTGRAGT